MSISDLTRAVVHAAMMEHDEYGAEAFCTEYGFEIGCEYVLVNGEHRYGIQALAAAAHAFLPGHIPLTPAEVADVGAVRKKLTALKFTVETRRLPNWTRNDLILACALLFENNREAASARDSRVRQLSHLLRSAVAPDEYGDKFRSARSVQDKLRDLQTRLREHTEAPARGSELADEVLREFERNQKEMQEKAEEIRSEMDRGAWALFSAEGKRKYDGNGGYPDVLGDQYVYDNLVSNSLQMRVGDLVVLWDAEQVHGVSRIERIDSQPDVLKPKQVCPNCGRSYFEPRKTRHPRYRCRHDNCRHEFDEPRAETRSVTQFVATYGTGYRPADGSISRDQVHARLRDKAAQNAIRRLDHAAMLTLLEDSTVSVPPRKPRKRKTPVGGHREGKTKIRLGQASFRDNLLAEHGARCAITGPCPDAALEAAHLISFAKNESHENGLLLRADVHKLFDRGLLAVHPDTLRVEIAPALAGYGYYNDFEGVSIPEGLDRAVVRDLYLTVTAKWKEE
ncbi:HNH endonuclease [Amycolatopsis halotolerans]|uniref:HNH endonuclease n=1 Tax=Amycolatopsis halotolerans TaxID=330083 RepID=A0ABV7QGN6_9PSEU